MQLTIIEEHDSCPYNGKEERPIVETVEINEKNFFKVHTGTNKIIILLEGEMYASIGINEPQKIVSNQMIYAAVEQNLIIKTATMARFLVFRIQERLKFCNCFVLDKLTEYAGTHECKLLAEGVFYTMPVHQVILEGVNSLLECSKGSLNCRHFHYLKLNELLFLVGKLYPLSDLVSFFRDTLTTDIAFSDYIRKNAYKFRTVKELAESMNYTISGFEKRFKKVFSTTPYQWMKEKKAQRIFYDLSMTDRCLKELVDDYGFRSSNYFIDFCKSNFGDSPGTIRKNRGKKIKS